MFSTECERLIRRILVVDPLKRYSIRQMKLHKWMDTNNSSVSQTTDTSMSLPTDTSMSLSSSTSDTAAASNTTSFDFDEQVLKLMHKLKIDQNKALEVNHRLLTTHTKYIRTFFNQTQGVNWTVGVLVAFPLNVQPSLCLSACRPVRVSNLIFISTIVKLLWTSISSYFVIYQELRSHPRRTDIIGNMVSLD